MVAARDERERRPQDPLVVHGVDIEVRDYRAGEGRAREEQAVLAMHIGVGILRLEQGVESAVDFPIVRAAAGDIAAATAGIDG